jgi:hypothetical protein
MFRKTVAALVCAALATSGCASASGSRVAQVTPAPVMDRAVLADYVQRLAAGSRVRVERTDGPSLRGILIKATPQSIIVQRTTRVPEPPVELPLDQLTRVTLDNSGSMGRTVAMGVAIGVGAGFGIFLLLVALIAD